MYIKDKDEFLKCFNVLCAAHNEKIDRNRIEIYFAGLNDLSIDQVREATNILIKTKKFFPKIAEFYEALAFTGEEHEKHIEMIAVEQWEELTCESDENETLIIKDIVAAKALEATGGWYNLMNSNDKRRIWLKKEFVDYYKYYFHNKEYLNPRTCFRGRLDYCETRVVSEPNIPKRMFELLESDFSVMKRLKEADGDEE